MSALTLDGVALERRDRTLEAAIAYGAFTLTTASYPQGYKDFPLAAEGTIYTALGAGNELGELAECFLPSNIEHDRIGAYQRGYKELGDVLWYLTRIGSHELTDVIFTECFMIAYDSIPRSRDMDSYTYLTGVDACLLLMVHVGKLLGVVKKMIRDGAGWTLEYREKKRNELRLHLIDALASMMHLTERTLPVVGITGGIAALMKQNTDKLQDRKDRGVLRGDGDVR